VQTTLKLTPEGHLVIPETILNNFQWTPETELILVETAHGLLLKTKKRVKETTVEEVAGCLRYDGIPKTLEHMEQGIAIGAKEHS